MTTILEALENSEMNFETLGRMGMAQNPIYQIAMSQLKNSIEALEQGKAANDILELN